MTFSFLITSFLNSFAMVFASAKILDSKINYKSYKVYLVTLVLTLYSFIMYQVTHSFMRIVILVQLYVICNFFIHYMNKKTLEEVTIASVFSWLLFFASELICALIILLISEIFNYTPKLFANEIISLFVICVFLIIVLSKYVNRLIKKLIHFIIELKIKNLIFTALYVIILLSISLNFIFFDLSIELKVVLFLIILIGYSIILFYI